MFFDFSLRLIKFHNIMLKFNGLFLFCRCKYFDMFCFEYLVWFLLLLSLSYFTIFLFILGVGLRKEILSWLNLMFNNCFYFYSFSKKNTFVSILMCFFYVLYQKICCFYFDVFLLCWYVSFLINHLHIHLFQQVFFHHS